MFSARGILAREAEFLYGSENDFSNSWRLDGRQILISLYQSNCYTFNVLSFDDSGTKILLQSVCNLHRSDDKGINKFLIYSTFNLCNHLYFMSMKLQMDNSSYII